MHERSLMTGLLRQVLAVAEQQGARRVCSVSVRLGALSHFTPEHFAEHFVDVARGTPAEGAVLQATLCDDAADEHALDVLIESVEVEVEES